MNSSVSDLYQSYKSPSQRHELAEPYMRNLIARYLTRDRNAKIVDIGCGDGSLLCYLNRSGFTNLFGCDLSPTQVHVARARGLRHIDEAAASEYLSRLTNNSVDTVITFDVLEHVPCQDLVSFAGDIRRVLSPGGSWIIHVPNAASPFGMRIRYGDLTHENAFTVTSLQQLFASVGLRGATFKEDAPIVHGPISAVRWILWHTMRSFLVLFLASETGTLSGHILSQNLLAIATKLPE